MIFGPLEKWGHRPPLDGLRAIAALLVVWFHAGWQDLSGGYVGVDVFFVLSGFLITSILIRELNTGRIDFLRFYARRVRRLLPSALLVLVLTALATRLMRVPIEWYFIRPGALTAAGWTSNWWFLADAQDYFAEDQGVSPFLHFWSLSIEEQFYLAWPALLLGIGVVARRLPVAAFYIVLGLALASLATSWWHTGMDAPMLSYFGTHTRAWQPLAGAALAVGIALWGPPGRGGTPLAGLGLLTLVAASLDVLPFHEPLARGAFAVVGTVALLAGLESGPKSAIARLLSVPALRVLGDWSYGIYLWHWPLVVLFGDHLPDHLGLRVAAVTALSVGLAGLSTTLLEGRVRRVSVEGRAGRAVLVGLAGVASTAAFIALALPLDDDTRRLAATVRPSAEITPVLGGGAHVVLAGDSHMERLGGAFAVLAEEEDWSLSPVISHACPWADTPWTTVHGRPLNCTLVLPEADLIVLSSRSIVFSVKTEAGLVAPEDPAWVPLVEEGSRRLLVRAQQRAPRVVIIEGLPEVADKPEVCLSEGTEPDCSAAAVAVPRAEEIDAMWRRLAEEMVGVETLDLDAVVCPDAWCPAVVDGVMTRTDTNHLSPDYAASLAPMLRARLEPLP